MDATLMQARCAPAGMLALTLVLALSLAGGTAQAQAAADPTQPPAVLSPRSAAAAADAPREQRLQAVIRGAEGRRTAIIGGQLVAVGDTLSTEAGPARVAAIHDDRVVLVRGSARETLALHPSITSPVATDATATKSPSRRP